MVWHTLHTLHSAIALFLWRHLVAIAQESFLGRGVRNSTALPNDRMSWSGQTRLRPSGYHAPVKTCSVTSNLPCTYI